MIEIQDKPDLLHLPEIQDLSKPDLLHLRYPRFPSIGCIPYVFSQQLLAGLRLAKQVIKTFGLVPHACQFQSCMFCHSSFLVVLGVDWQVKTPTIWE